VSIEPSVWTPERVEILRQLSASGMTDTQMAEHWGTTRWAIDSARKRYGIATGYRPPNTSNPPADFHVYAESQTIAAGAARWKAANKTVRGWYAQTGLKPAARVYSNKRRERKAQSAGKPYYFMGGVTALPVPLRGDTVAASAQLHLQHYGPVFKASTIKPHADGWIVFGRHVSEADLIAIAQRKGFVPFSLAA
jgi:hypothetical protein